MAQKSVIGLILVVGLVAAAGWCFMAGPCKGWLSNLGGGLGNLGNSIGGVLNPIENKLQTSLNNALSQESLKGSLKNGKLVGGFAPVPTGASDGSIVSQSQMPISGPTASFTRSYMGHLSYW